MNFQENRAEQRVIVNKYYSVQFSIEGLDSVYQFILWDLSTHGMCILIEKDSGVLNFLAVGDVFRMRYYPQELLKETKCARTEIRHISNGGEGRFKDFYMVGLKILENETVS